MRLEARLIQNSTTLVDSELQLQGELNRARAANLVERVEASVGTAGAQAARQSLRRFAEQRAG